MDYPDNVSTMPSSPEGIVSDVTRTLSSVSLVPLNQDPRTITNLPPEMILRIYMHLDGPSEIAALNRTSRVHYWIWRMNATSISDAILPQYIECYNSALELFEVEERVKQIHCIMLPQFAVLTRIRVAQREARDVVQHGRRNDRHAHISRNTFYGGVLYRNERLLTASKDASHLLGLIENRVVYNGGTPSDGFVRDQAAPSSHDIIIAYHELVILRRLRSFKAMNHRLTTLGKHKIQKMLYVATYLVCYCPDNDKIRFGISRKLTLRILPWSWVIDARDLEPRPRCHFIVAARTSFFVVAHCAAAAADAVEEARLSDQLLETLHEHHLECHGDCEEGGKSKAK